MKELSYTLLSDGSSDRRLIPVLSWLLHQSCPSIAIQVGWADLSRLRRPQTSLRARIKLSLDLYPCDILFIHRDAENQSADHQREEIAHAIRDLEENSIHPPAICVIAIRMQEAWLLIDECVIRKAACNQHGSVPITLPRLSDLGKHCLIIKQGFINVSKMQVNSLGIA